MKINELVEGIVDEISLGDYSRKAKLDQASRAMSRAFGHDQSDETKAKHSHKIDRREAGLARAKARAERMAAERAAKAKADHEQAIRAKYDGVDIDAEIAKLKPALDRAYSDYQYGARNTWSQGRDDYHSIQGKIQQLQQAKKILGGLDEEATAGGTSAGMVSVGAVHKNQSPKMQKPTDNALDGDNLMTGGSIKR